MNKEVYAYNKDGKLELKLPDVKIGHERLDREHNLSRIASKMILCREHGTVPMCHVKKAGISVLCCPKCVRKYCNCTESIVRLPAYCCEDANEGNGGGPEKIYD